PDSSRVTRLIACNMMGELAPHRDDRIAALQDAIRQAGRPVERPWTWTSWLLALLGLPALAGALLGTVLSVFAPGYARGSLLLDQASALLGVSAIAAGAGSGLLSAWVANRRLQRQLRVIKRRMASFPRDVQVVALQRLLTDGPGGGRFTDRLLRDLDIRPEVSPVPAPRARGDEASPAGPP